MLTWVLSGLLSMNPWGLMESSGAGLERAQLRGAPITGSQLRSALQSLAAAAPSGAVSIQSAQLAGKLFLIATDADGSRQRVDAGGAHHRWWHDALHRMDFAAVIRGRPQWDILMWLLMSGVTAVCVTGTYLGYRRLVR